MAQLANDAAEDRQFPLRACHQAITMAHEYAQTTLHTCENAVGSHFDLMQTWMSSSNSWGQNCQRIADTIVSMQKTLLQQMSEQGKLLPGLWMQMGAKALAPLQADPAKN